MARHLVRSRAPARHTSLRATNEWVVGEVGAPVGPVDVGLTLSQLEKVRTVGGPEIVHVVAFDGATNIELILARLPLFGQFIELQGPAINRAGDGKIGFRLFGLGFTGDLNERGSIKALSYTAEIKLTSRSLGRAALALLPDGMRLSAAIMGGIVGEAIAIAVPVVSAILAVHSGVTAWRVLRDPGADRRHKGLAVAHFSADVVRIALPGVGVLVNVALVGGNALYEALLGRRAALDAVDPELARAHQAGLSIGELARVSR